MGTGLTIVSMVSRTTLPWLTSTRLPEALSDINATNTIAEIGTRNCFIVVDFNIVDDRYSI